MPIPADLQGAEIITTGNLYEVSTRRILHRGVTPLFTFNSVDVDADAGLLSGLLQLNKKLGFVIVHNSTFHLDDSGASISKLRCWDEDRDQQTDPNEGIFLGFDSNLRAYQDSLPISDIPVWVPWLKFEDAWQATEDWQGNLQTPDSLLTATVELLQGGLYRKNIYVFVGRMLTHG